ncbi:hypothetical protein CAEBREN_08013 [Caenorhabditis brenneri]|uniref:GH18 domain-containing protein n=1 Tax=Caenorhabditis brenneri TaxID=135651 RepID=G0NAG8_CAEBE|nr:hypothetical protein CAEBREN_08013 [Caenorhabditis brenneri]
MYSTKNFKEPRSSTKSQSVPIVSQELTNIINSAPPVYKTRIIGYYGEFESRDIKKSQLEKLTHAIVACVRMDKSGRLKFKDEEMRQKFLSLKTKASNMESGAKVMVSVGGNDNSEHFTTIMASARRRKKLINQIILFITEHQIEGVNLFWEQPPESHKFKYSKFLKNLRLKLSEQEKKDDKKYILSLVVPRAGIGNWESGFDLDVIIENVDFINVLTMDYYAPWPSDWGAPVGPSAPLYSGVGPKSHYNVNHTMQYYICETRRPDKFNIIIPFYIRLWRNVNERLKPESEVFRNVELIDGKVEGTPYMSKWTVDHEGWKRQESSWCRASSIILVVLFVCGISALGLSAVFWHFYEYFEKKTKPLACGKRIVGFYSENESSGITQNQLEKLTHAVFAYLEMRFDGDIDFKSEKASRRFSSLKDQGKKAKSDLKVMISIGGIDNSEHFAPVSVDKHKRTNFIAKIASFLQKHNIDGVNLYWTGVTENGKWKYIKLLKDLKGLLSSIGNTTNKKYTISITAPSVNVHHEEMAYDVDQILEYVDFINVISMDYDDSTSKEIGPIAPLFSNNSFNVDSTMRYYICKTGKPNMFNIVIPFFMRFWENVEEVEKLHFKTSHLREDKSRWSTKKEKKLSPITWVDDSIAYNQEARTVIAFETKKSVQAKIDYLNKMKLGGVWIWSVDMDDETSSLLDSVYSDDLCSIQDDKISNYIFCSE